MCTGSCYLGNIQVYTLVTGVHSGSFITILLNFQLITHVISGILYAGTLYLIIHLAYYLYSVTLVDPYHPTHTYFIMFWHWSLWVHIIVRFIDHYTTATVFAFSDMFMAISLHHHQCQYGRHQTFGSLCLRSPSHRILIPSGSKRHSMVPTSSAPHVHIVHQHVSRGG